MENKNSQNHSLAQGGTMSHDTNLTLTLSPDPRGNYVTWAQGKKQVRAMLKTAGYKAVGLFRPRKANKNEFYINCVRDNKTFACTVARKPNAPLTFTHLG